MGKKLEMFKLGAGVGLSLGVSAIVTGIVNNNVDRENAGPVKKVCVGLAALVVTSMVAKKANDHFDELVDSVVGDNKETNKVDNEEKTEEKTA